MTRVAVMGGDGIGPEVVGATMHILEQMDLDLEFVKAHMGLNCFERTGEYLPAQTLRTLESEAPARFARALQKGRECRSFLTPGVGHSARLDPCFRIPLPLGLPFLVDPHLRGRQSARRF